MCNDTGNQSRNVELVLHIKVGELILFYFSYLLY